MHIFQSYINETVEERVRFLHSKSHNIVYYYLFVIKILTIYHKLLIYLDLFK